MHLVVVEEADISLVGAEGEVHAADSLQVINKIRLFPENDFGPPLRPLLSILYMHLILTLGLNWSCDRFARPPRELDPLAAATDPERILVEI